MVDRQIAAHAVIGAKSRVLPTALAGNDSTRQASEKKPLLIRGFFLCISRLSATVSRQFLGPILGALSSAQP